jgi:putative glutamine amidotransferase
MNRRRFLLSFALASISAIAFAPSMLAQLTAPPVVETNRQSVSTEPIRSTDRVQTRPVIGIASLNSDPYVRAVRQCGGIPVVLPNTDGNLEAIEEYLELIDGLIMPGGDDIPPSDYGEAQHANVKLLKEDRYRFEKGLVKAWIEKTDKPLLGICLGSQWINVAHGGNLVQDIPSELGGHPRGVSHTVILKPDSRLYAIYGQTEFEVNSLHHQSVKKVGQGLRAVAVSPDGVIEATEGIDPDRFLIGVQWHPEKLLPNDKLHEKLFRAFIDAASQAEQ